MRFTLAVLSLLLFPAAASADECADKRLGFSAKGTLRHAEFGGGGGVLGRRTLTLGEPVQGALRGGHTYHVPRKGWAKVKLRGYTYRLAGGSVFIPQCTFDDRPSLYMRLLERSVRVTGPRVSMRATSSPAWVVTPEGSFLAQRGGRPNFTVERVVTSKASRTRSTVSAGRGSGSVQVKLSPVLRRPDLSCQFGQSITLYLDGKVKRAGGS